MKRIISSMLNAIMLAVSLPIVEASYMVSYSTTVKFKFVKKKRTARKQPTDDIYFHKVRSCSSWFFPCIYIQEWGDTSKHYFL